MQTYFDNDDKPSIQCWECSRKINSADDLIRYYGANLHKECFKAVYEEEKRTRPDDTEYFDLVLNSIDA